MIEGEELKRLGILAGAFCFLIYFSLITAALLVDPVQYGKKAWVPLPDFVRENLDLSIMRWPLRIFGLVGLSVGLFILIEVGRVFMRPPL